MPYLMAVAQTIERQIAPRVGTSVAATNLLAGDVTSPRFLRLATGSVDLFSRIILFG
jgi:hypothetical protein